MATPPPSPQHRESESDDIHSSSISKSPWRELVLWAGRHPQSQTPYLLVRLGAAVRLNMPEEEQRLMGDVLVQQATHGLTAHCLTPPSGKRWREIAVVVDCDGLSLRHRPPLDVIRDGIPALLNAAESHGGACTSLLLVHVPPTMSFVLTLIRGVLSAETRKKLRLLRTREWLELSASLTHGARLAGSVPWRTTGETGRVEVAAHGDSISSLRQGVPSSPTRTSVVWDERLDDAAMACCGAAVSAVSRALRAFFQHISHGDAAAAGENVGNRPHDKKSAPPTTRWHYGWWPGEALPSARL